MGGSFLYLLIFGTPLVIIALAGFAIRAGVRGGTSSALAAIAVLAVIGTAFYLLQ